MTLTPNKAFDTIYSTFIMLCPKDVMIQKNRVLNIQVEPHLKYMEIGFGASVFTTNFYHKHSNRQLTQKSTLENIKRIIDLYNDFKTTDIDDLKIGRNKFFL